MSINLTLVSVFPKAEADAPCPAEVLARGVAAGWLPVEMGTDHGLQGKHEELQQYNAPWPNAWYSDTYCWQ